MQLASLLAEAKTVQFDYSALREAERLLYGAGPSTSSTASKLASGDFKSDVLQEIAEARKRINETLQAGGAVGSGSASSNMEFELVKRVDGLEKENKQMKGELSDLRKLVHSLESQLQKLSVGGGTAATGHSVASKKSEPQKSYAKAAEPDKEDDDDEDIDLFGSDDEEQDEEKERIKQERLKAYAEKKDKKPGPIAKSSVILDVKPWDDETNMQEMEKQVRTIEMDGLLWGASKLVPLAYGIKKLQIMCTVEDEKVSIDELQEKIEEFEELVQSVDIAAFNKI